MSLATKKNENEKQENIAASFNFTAASKTNFKGP
jgi:hypothetical protein